MRVLFAVLFATLFAGPIAAAPEESALDVSRLAWMSGDWRSVNGDEVSQEAWLEPMNGFMAGVFRLFVGERLVMHEYMAVTREGEDILFRDMKHMRDATGAWKEHGPTVLRLDEQGENFARFVNIAPSDDAPGAIAYARDGGRMVITVTDPPAAVVAELGDKAKRELSFEFRLEK